MGKGLPAPTAPSTAATSYRYPNPCEVEQRCWASLRLDRSDRHRPFLQSASGKAGQARYTPAEFPSTAFFYFIDDLLVMSIYILPVVIGPPQGNEYYRAAYLEARTAQALTSSISAKCGIGSSTVIRTVHVNSRGLTILVDDEFVREMPEGQDMKVQAVEVHEESPFASPPQEWVNSDGSHPGCDIDPAKNLNSHGWELRLVY